MSFALNENNLCELKRRQVKHEVKIRVDDRDMNAINVILLHLRRREKVNKTIQPPMSSSRITLAALNKTVRVN